MDFAAVLSAIAADMDRHELRYAVVGGIALAGLGMPRTTIDLDIVTDAEAQAHVVAFLEGLGFETVHRSAAYSNHLHREPALGRVDVVYVRRDTAEQLFASVQRVPGPGGLDMPVPAAEHLVAMKVLAMKNDPRREPQELVDIRFLLARPDVDREQVREYFLRHGLLKQLHDVERDL
ncbi:MAG TPA: nucleotidyl transferase AbiEii/AbiGii toxin family protein [Thermoanaerobaculia bacterium]|jgi:hypothetical protein|nr:nucleotidyl transferase AbiEii/AbiGii toxin family protein [Thermoanaerobaculia bacterium]